jgi:hypothetical protein
MKKLPVARLQVEPYFVLIECLTFQGELVQHSSTKIHSLIRASVCRTHDMVDGTENIAVNSRSAVNSQQAQQRSINMANNLSHASINRADRVL